MPRIITTPISGNQCIGDSLVIINNNYEALDTAVYALSTNTISVSSTATITPVLLPSATAYPWTKQLAADVNDLSITSTKIANSAVTTTKVATDAITYSRLATLSSVGSLSAEAVQPRLAKAWVSFDGTTATPVISSSYNVASVTKNSLGLYTLTFTNPLANTAYTILGGGSKAVAFSGPVSVYKSNTANPTRNNVVITTYDPRDGSQLEVQYNYVVIFGD